MGGGMEANKNKFIEEWSSARENLEHNFRWSRRNLALVGLFGLALPILVYKGIVREFVISPTNLSWSFRFISCALSTSYAIISFSFLCGSVAKFP